MCIWAYLVWAYWHLGILSLGIRANWHLGLSSQISPDLMRSVKAIRSFGWAPTNKQVQEEIYKLYCEPVEDQEVLTKADMARKQMTFE